MTGSQNDIPSTLRKKTREILAEKCGFTDNQSESFFKLLGIYYEYALEQARNELKQEETELREKQIKAAKKLLKNYREIEAAVSSGVDHTVFVLDDTEIERLMVREDNSKNETARHKAMAAAANRVLFLRINTALKELKNFSEHSSNPVERRYYDVLHQRYVLNWTSDATCAYFGNISKTHYYKQIEKLYLH